MATIYQGANTPLIVTFDQDVSGLDALTATLWRAGMRASSVPIKRWDMEDMDIDGDTASLPLTEAETSQLKEHQLVLEIKGLDEGVVRLWQSVPIDVAHRFDGGIALGGDANA